MTGRRHIRTRANSPASLFAEIRDPIHGYVFANDAERSIIDTETFQRLRRIRQLAGCFLVYPGGQHSRFEHAIGAMFLAGEAGSVLESRAYLSFSPEDTELLRLAALLHDIGHGPFSHMFEEVMAYKTKLTHEDMTKKIIRATEIGDILQQNGVDKVVLSELAIGKCSLGGRYYMNDLISGGLSVDLMDYLPRDAYFTGVEYGRVDVNRIINSLEVVGKEIAIAEAAKFAFEALIIARYEMFRAVYFHRTVRAAELMLIRSMILADKELNLTDLSLDNYLSMTDEITLDRIRKIKPSGDSDLETARSLADRYFARKLLKCVYERPVQRKRRTFLSFAAQKKFTTDLALEIASSADADVGEIFVDAPTAPSVPLSSAKESLERILLVKSGAASSAKSIGRDSSYALRIEELPLVNAISGYLDIVRIYSSARENERIKKAVARVLGPETIA